MRSQAAIIDGNRIAASIRAELKSEISLLKMTWPQQPCLAVVLVGTARASQVYVNLKHKAAQEIGMPTIAVTLPETVTQDELEEKIQQLNEDPTVHGFIVQLPLPPHIDEARALEKISPTKDVDGLHAVNVGMLQSRGKQPYFIPCTPLGVLELLHRSNVPLQGKRAVVIGRSNIVGNPVAQLLLQANATPTLCHRFSENLAETVREADIVIACCGQPQLIRGSWLKPGCSVIDVGTSAVADSTKKAGFRLVGDVHFGEARDVASLVTPVPGGVGPMTIAMLLRNTLRGFKRTVGIPQPAPSWFKRW